MNAFTIRLTLISVSYTMVAGCDNLSPCRSQCELAAGGCDERPIEDFGDFDATRAAWTADLGEANCEQAFPFLVAGQCGSDGLLFLFRGGGFTTETHFFNADTRAFVALRTSTDVIASPCFGRSYWPEEVNCMNATGDEVLCGTRFSAGEEIELP